ncbi:hypothetical protein FNN66_19280 [Salmonella enterica subsp. arizonae]|nr:hypothetical protein [Salmonella enterica subsp. arizonae]EGI5759062.1 hypothetical protein [Salmonella enterica subsp. enterica serovar Alachua]
MCFTDYSKKREIKNCVSLPGLTTIIDVGDIFAGIPTTAPARPEAKLLAFPALDAPVRSQNCWQIAAVT